MADVRDSEIRDMWHGKDASGKRPSDHPADGLDLSAPEGTATTTDLKR